MMRAGIKFILIFAITLAVMLFVFMTYAAVYINETFVLAMILIALIVGFFAVLHHKKIVHGNNWVFVIGFIMFVASGIILVGAVSFNGKPEKYWDISPQVMTYLLVSLIVGLLLAIAGFRQIVKFWGYRK
jgi:hypothetical protein